jgi:hypothetical protein
MACPLARPASGPTNRSLTTRPPQSGLPAGKCSCSWSGCAGLSPLIFPCLRTQMILLDPPLR